VPEQVTGRSDAGLSNGAMGRIGVVGQAQ
jgi:hypothetical protein